MSRINQIVKSKVNTLNRKSKNQGVIILICLCLQIHCIIGIVPQKQTAEHQAVYDHTHVVAPSQHIAINGPWPPDDPYKLL